ncbi:hypothetical protein ACJW31_11G146100 [Castanea mollissima]
MNLFHLILQSALPWLLLLLLGVNMYSVSAVEEYQTYIIHMDHCQKPSPHSTHESWHRSILKSLLSSPADDDEELLIYSYSHVMHGFSARLTPTQLSKIQNSSAHIATYPESFGKLLTTHAPKFLRLQQKSGISPAASFGKGVIVSFLDTGIWPESESFNDKGMPPVPKRWKGKCEKGQKFSPSYCNRKLIGARSFSKGLRNAGIKISKEDDYNSARDFSGNHVPGVSYFGYARGTARGMAPRAHLAVYKVSWATETNRTAATDVLAGMDQAIHDGVDILSLSISINLSAYFIDYIAEGSLSAIEKGIFVACAAGNDGVFATVVNAAPWITTVGAGTLDRSYLATMTLGNGVTMEGTSYFPESVSFTNLTLYYGKGNTSKAICSDKSLDRNDVAGKVVICDSYSVDPSQQILEVERAGAYAAIFLSNLSISLSLANYTFPCLTLPDSSATLVKENVTRVRNPKVKRIQFVLTKLGTKPAPQVAFCSSAGPNPFTPGILKPDIIAPGMDVLAAFTPNVPFVTVGNYDLVTDYALMWGTSMSTPIVAGVGALLRAIHPEWSPAAIRSALMTTAYVKDNTGASFTTQLSNSIAAPIQLGAGHIDPNKAMDPGLIYDTSFQDYVDFLCGLGYTNEQMRHKLSHELNYPSFMVVLSNQTTYPMSMNFSRVVTNVEYDTSVYQAHLEDIPDGMKIRVEPSTLTFTKKNQKQSFVVSVEINIKLAKVIHCFLKWIDQHSHIVSSPIAAVNLLTSL